MARRSSLLLVLCVLASLVVPWGSHAAQTPVYRYVRMSDGAAIAISVWYPSGYTPGSTWPALFEMDGYDGANFEYPTAEYANRYVQIRASIRGTGCSQGSFDLFSDRSARDGYEIIEDWIVKQPWSNGRVGITGLSYPGLTGFYVAATQPPHVKAVAIAGLIDDYYRGILWMGGILNAGFPVLWAGAARMESEYTGSAHRFVGSLREGEMKCDRNLVRRSHEDVEDPNLLLALYTNSEDLPGNWSAQHSLLKYVPRINVPIQITNTWQDEQTGARGGAALFQRIPAGVPKRLILSNARHTDSFALNDRRAWLDCWVINDGNGCGAVTDPARRVKAYFDTTEDSPANLLPPLEGADFPLPAAGAGATTAWQRLYLRKGHALSPSAPASEKPDSYLSSIGSPLAQAPYLNAVRYRIPIAADTAIMGPIVADLYARLDGPDADFFVTLTDVFPDGGRQVLERGMLRASHRALDVARSDVIAGGPLDGQVYRPWHPHVNPKNVKASSIERYSIEVFPFGQILRAGHVLELSISAPPLQDPISEFYTYEMLVRPVHVEILHDAAHPSSLLLPFVSPLPAKRSPAPGCGAMTGGRLMDELGTPLPCFPDRKP
jgi:uncharacterized protein